ncbi:NUDIX domain-containing protein [Brevibacterium antiquum]|nr:NUDIX hydrolase [Brevibacterium sp. UCMA 11752]
MEITGVQIPAGSTGQGETPSDAAVREVWEETGLRVHAMSVQPGVRPGPR